MTREPAPPKETKGLTRLSLRELTDQLASSAPVPGGGTTAAISGAMAAGLVAMVAALTVGRPAYAEVDAAAAEIGLEAETLRQRLLTLAEDDAAAFDAVMRARRMPRETDEERALRRTAMEQAFVIAAEVPLETARAAGAVLGLAARIAPIGNRNAASDAGVAAQLASAAIRGACLNVRINLPYLPEDAPLATAGATEVARLEEEATRKEAAAVAAVAERIG